MHILFDLTFNFWNVFDIFCKVGYQASYTIIFAELVVNGLIFENYGNAWFSVRPIQLVPPLRFRRLAGPVPHMIWKLKTQLQEHELTVIPMQRLWQCGVLLHLRFNLCYDARAHHTFQKVYQLLSWRCIACRRRTRRVLARGPAPCPPCVSMHTLPWSCRGGGT